ncbi:hypothetical protein [Paraconexibacter algicola]|uniref:Uncharacterized protein n=1 Tax=Paraconexibacter algicola TaxID=2133960 RepID=A0A2T4UM47_9ACTN|nr:hypothetical protein [Paraconexibacter algicola]PTL60305.1 hypothetical protein C7Y72_11970 [Paraconexibacter algicola]
MKVGVEIERALEIDRSLEAPGQSWAAYAWLLGAAHRLGCYEVNVLVSSFRVFRRLGPAIGSVEARALFDLPHRYAFGGVVVRGVSWRGGWQVRGPALVVGADTARITAVEDAGVPAVVAVTSDPGALDLWIHVHRPLALGRTRQSVKVSREPLPEVVVAALRAATDLVNIRDRLLAEAHARRLAGALVALRAEGHRVPPGDLASFFLTVGWGSRLALDGAAVGRRVWDGETPRHDPWRLGRDSARR